MEVRFASLLSGGFTTVAVINSPEKKLANRTSVHWVAGANNTLTKRLIFQAFECPKSIRMSH